MICDKNFLIIISGSENIYIYVLKKMRLKFIIAYYDKKSIFSQRHLQVQLNQEPITHWVMTSLGFPAAAVFHTLIVYNIFV